MWQETNQYNGPENFLINVAFISVFWLPWQPSFDAHEVAVMKRCEIESTDFKNIAHC